MSRSRRLIILVLLLALAFPVAAGRKKKKKDDEQAPPPQPPQPGVTVESSERLDELRAVVPGRLVAYALPRTGDGEREIVVLVGPRKTGEATEPLPPMIDDKGGRSDEPQARPLPACPTDDEKEAPMALYRVVSDPPSLQPLSEGLPHDCSALESADLNGDGRDELLLGRPGEVSVVRNGTVESLLREPSLSWRSVHPRPTRHPELDGVPFVIATPLGGVDLYGPGVDGDGWSSVAAIDVPIHGNVWSTGLRVSNPVPRFAGLGSDGSLLFATWPEAFGSRRLRVFSARLSPGGGSSVEECWVRLPQPEEALDTRFLQIDGEVMLLLATKPDQKLNLFGEKRLRLFRLRPDRSRLGHEPVYETTSRMNIWQEARPQLLDVNGDGRRDLVIGYWKGIKDSRVVLDVYLREEAGWFETSVRTTGFDVKDGDRGLLLYGRDVDGDGRGDLLVRSEDQLLVYPGLPSSDGRDLVDDEPLDLGETRLDRRMSELNVQFGSSGGFQAWTAAGSGSPRLVDLDGDGTDEILQLVQRGEGWPDELRVLRVRPGS